MKRSRKRWICILLAAVIFALSAAPVLADEYSRPLRWQPKTNGFAHIKVTYQDLEGGSIYFNNRTAMQTAVNNSTAKVLITEVNTGANLSILSASGNEWVYTHGLDYHTIAFTVSYDSKGKIIKEYSVPSGSSGLIARARILINPNEYPKGTANELSESQQTSVLIHEVGHAIGLWHCTHSYPSVMKPITSSSPAYFTAHDNDCLKAYYGS